MWDLSSLTKDQTHTPCIGRQSLFQLVFGRYFEPKVMKAVKWEIH